MARKNKLNLMKITSLHFIDQETGKEKKEIKIKKKRWETGSKKGAMNTNYLFQVLPMENSKN